MTRRPPSVNTTPVAYAASIPELVDLLARPGPEAWAACTALAHNPDAEALQVLTNLATHRDWRFRRSALGALAAHPLARTAAPLVVAALSDPSEFVVRTACETASALLLAEAHATIVGLAASSDPRTREASIRALSRLWQPSDFPTVFHAFHKDAVVPVRRAAAWTLVANASPSNWRALFDAWVHGELPRYRVWACEIAGRFGDASVRPQLSALAHDQNGHVRKAATRVLAITYAT